MRAYLPKATQDDPRRPSRNLRKVSISWLGALDRLTQPLHGELDIRRLQIAPAFYLGLISSFWKALDATRVREGSFPMRLQPKPF
jgi:hypothetical protein